MKSCRIMTYNLHGCIGTDGEYDPERSYRVIASVSPDILALQEVRRNTGLDPEILDLLGNERPDYSILFLKTLTDRRGEYGNALVSRFPIAEHLDIDLEDHADIKAEKKRPEARRAIFARLDVPADCPVHTAPDKPAKTIWVVATHLALQGQVRKAQTVKLIDAVQQFTDLKQEAVICMGDFNEWRRPNAFIRRLDRLFSRHAARRTFPSLFPVLPLDRIWMSAAIRRKTTGAVKTPLSRRASDHLPLVLECEI